MYLRMTMAALTLGLGACAVKPEPFTLSESATRAAADRAEIENYSPIPMRPVSLEEAQARALAYNLDHRLQIFNAALQDKQLDLTKMDMLPNLTANAGYVARNRDLVSSSASFQSGVIAPSNLNTVSVDRERTFADLTLSWNILDFGVSYLQAKQQSDRVLVANEQRRRVVNNIFQQVRSAYWTAVAADRVRPRLRPILVEARRALESSRALEAERTQQPGEALRYQRALLELIQQLESVDDQLSIAKTQLAQLMGLRPGTSFALASPRSLQTPSSLRLTIDQMERVALVNRPEVQEEGYNARITQVEGRRALLRLLPGVTLLSSLNYDSNSYLLYNNWSEAGARVAASVVRLMSAPAVMELNDVQAEIADSRRLAVTMAVLAQVQVSAQQYAIARKSYAMASSMADIDQRIANLSQDAQTAETSSELDLIREKANAVLAELRRNRAFADLQNADASIYATLGLDPIPAGLENSDLDTLVAAIQEKSREWRSGRIPVPAFDDNAPAAKPAPVGGAVVAVSAKS